MLQISAPSDFGRNLLLGWLDEFRQQHPHIQLQLLINDRQADLFREPVDVALRFGPLADSSLVALPILPQHRRLICASPDYLRRHGARKRRPIWPCTAFWCISPAANGRWNGGYGAVRSWSKCR